LGYTQVGLEDKILIMYPEVRDLSPRFSYDESKETWVVKLKKGSHEQTVFITFPKPSLELFLLSVLIF
jgi:hypothetical protein